MPTGWKNYTERASSSSTRIHSHIESDQLETIKKKQNKRAKEIEMCVFFNKVQPELMM